MNGLFETHDFHKVFVFVSPFELNFVLSVHLVAFPSSHFFPAFLYLAQVQARGGQAAPGSVSNM